MKKHSVFLILILFSLYPLIETHGQQGSRDLLAEYCIKNWIRDLDKCVDYIPKDYNERKTEYQAQEAEKIRQETLQSKSDTESPRVCPVGSHLSVDNFGNQVCVDSKTNQVVASPNTGQSDDSGLMIGLFVMVVIILMIAAIFKKKKKPEPESYKDVLRVGFSRETKEAIKERQNGRCAHCGAIPTHWEFDHIRSRGDSSIDNCQGLCRDCHQTKTLNEG
ncbi:MAG: HNH endonuclease [Nitrososphaeraceae archaeon]